MGNFGYVYDLVFERIAVYRPKTQKKTLVSKHVRATQQSLFTSIAWSESFFTGYPIRQTLISSLIFMSQALPPGLVSNHALRVQRIKGVCKARQLPKHTHTHTHSFTFWIELAQLVTPVSYCIYVDCVLVALLVWCLFTRLSYFQTFRCMT